jgi:hypothetical protein
MKIHLSLSLLPGLALFLIKAQHFVAFIDQATGKVGTILSCNSGDQCFFHRNFCYTHNYNQDVKR